MKNTFNKWLTNWDSFWFSERSLYLLGLFRIVLCSVLAFMYWSRQFDVDLYFTENGILPRQLALEIFPEFMRPPYLLALWPDSLAPTFHLLLVSGLLLLAFGVGGRFLNILVWLLHIAFLQRNYSIAFGADLIGGIFLFLMSGTQSCARFSILNLISYKEIKSDLFTNVFFRLIQIQLSIIYFYTGIEKLKGMPWWDGTALWTVLANPQMVIADLTWVKDFTFFIIFMTYATILFEIYFPVFILFKNTRKYILSFGVLFHSGIGLLVALWNFALIMMAPYILFLDEKNVSTLINKFLSRLKMRQFFSN